MPEFGEGKLSVDRRELLALGAGGLGALALSSSPLSVASALAASNSSAWPNYYPAPVAPPDIPGDATGLEPGYINFPRELVKLVNETPASGGDVTAMTLWVNPIPTPVDRNAAWQQLNEALGANIKMTLVPQADYAAKWGTVTASGDLPDLMYISIVPVLPNVAAFVNSACVDLSEYLGGDAVKDYPGLANLPTACWSQGMIEGKLWGVPISRARSGWPMYVQITLLEKLGMAGDWPTNADAFKAFCADLTDPAAGRWAIGVTNDTTTGPYSMTWFQGVFGAPNKWRVQSDGSMLKDIETDEYQAALEFVRELVELGYISPDVKANPDVSNDLFAGKIVMRANAWNAYKSLYVDNAKTLNQVYRTIPPFGHDGGPGSNLLGPGNFGWVAIKKSDPDRVRELLRVMNYLASPIGSQEFMVSKFGVEGVDYNYNEKGAPVYTDTGIAELPGAPNTGPWGYAATPAPYLFSGEVPEFAQFASDAEKQLLAVGVADPTLGHYSKADARMGAQLERLIFDRVSDIAAGRKPMSDLDQLVTDWRSQGGDQIRAEYEEAIGG
jgi:putative aldouronate transport system substrate-binding protein